VRAVIQRVTGASVTVSGQTVSSIEAGLVVLLGVAGDDTPTDVRYVASKIHGLRIFADADGRMNLSVGETGGSVLVVSQFTLYGDTRRGRRPSFTGAAEPVRARELYEALVGELEALGTPVAVGVFQAEMQLSLVNDGPVTILVDSRKVF
jgi:D-tyrosyl-tRNA(Tyr) deacylase